MDTLPSSRIDSVRPARLMLVSEDARLVERVATLIGEANQSSSDNGAAPALYKLDTYQAPGERAAALSPPSPDAKHFYDLIIVDLGNGSSLPTFSLEVADPAAPILLLTDGPGAAPVPSAPADASEQPAGEGKTTSLADSVPIDPETDQADSTDRDAPRRTDPWVGRLVDRIDKHSLTPPLLARAIEWALERSQLVERLSSSEERFRLMADNAPTLLWISDPGGSILFVNRTWSDFRGIRRDEAVGTRFEDMVDPEDCARVRSELTLAARESRSFAVEARMMRYDQQWIWMIHQGVPWLDASGHLIGFMMSSVDISEQKRAQEQLYFKAFHDALTNLPNRELFLDRLSRALQRTRRRPDLLFAVLFLDLDRFKVLNDTLGHSLADHILVGMSDRLRRCLRPEDTVARFGGDEFIVLLEGISSEVDAMRVADRILEELRAPFFLSDREVVLTTSIGIAITNEGYKQAEEVIRDADTAMYQAKAFGRAQYQVFQPGMHARALTLRGWESGLRRALDQHEFNAYYQPIVGLDTGTICGFEALLRWVHPKYGIVGPNEFMKVAEETGLTIPIGLWILREACQQIREWRLRFPNLPWMRVSVNLSRRQFLHEGLEDQILRILEDTALPHSCLKLDVPESVIMDRSQPTLQMLSRLHRIPVQLHVDDFGTGVSSLRDLHHFPIDTLKIDRSIISRMSSDSRSVDIVRTIVILAKNLGAEVIAVGVETAEQLEELRKFGCQYAQGNFFSEPISADVATALLAREPRW